MTRNERIGRITLAAAVLLLFLAIFASMISGEFQTLLIVPIVAIGVVGYILMSTGRRG